VVVVAAAVVVVAAAVVVVAAAVVVVAAPAVVVHPRTNARKPARSMLRRAGTARRIALVPHPAK
jgi:hypothetical protein